MKNIFNITITICITLLFSCNSDKTNSSKIGKNNELEILKERLKNDSLLLLEMGNEMEQIDKAISEITAFTSSGNKSVPEKIKEMEDLIVKSNSKIVQLEKMIAESNSSFKNSSALTKSLEAQKKLIEEQKNEIERLTGKVIELEDKITTKNSEIGGLKTTNSNLSKNVEDAEKRLRQLNNEIRSAQSDKNSLESKINQEYMNMATTLVELAEDNKGIFKNADNQRRDMAIKAFEYYCKLHKRGVYSGLSSMSALQNHKKLGKYVRGQNCN